MLTKVVLASQDLQEVLAGIWEYNQRGPVVAVRFFGADGSTLPVAWVEVMAEDAGLRVRSRPELTPEQIVSAIGMGIGNGNG